VLLTRISQGLKDYVDTSQKGMTKIVKVSDEHFANATGKLGSAVSELDDVLQGLTEAIHSLRSAANGARK